MKKMVCLLALAGFLTPAAAAPPYRLRVQIEHDGSVQSFSIDAVKGEARPVAHLATTTYIKDCSLNSSTKVPVTTMGEIRTGTSLNVQPLGETEDGVIFTLGLNISELVRIRTFQPTPKCVIQLPDTHTLDIPDLSVTLQPGQTKVLPALDERAIRSGLKPYIVTVERL